MLTVVRDRQGVDSQRSRRERAGVLVVGVGVVRGGPKSKAGTQYPVGKNTKKRRIALTANRFKPIPENLGKTWAKNSAFLRENWLCPWAKDSRINRVYHA